MMQMNRQAEDWWRGAVIYQIYPRSFFDSNGDGIGDLPGVTAKLDYVARLGVDAIWLCPFFCSPQADFGYDVSDHVSVDPIFGTLADFDALVERAHDLGLKVLIDQVWSHTSDRHPWFLASRAGREGPHADWYVWADPLPDGTAPNNWLSVFGGAAWAWEPRRRQYYLHHFLREQPALNLHNPDVVDAILESGEFWLRRGVDGFRLDAIDFMLHDRQLRPNPPAPVRTGGVPAKLFGLQRHDHDMMQPETAGVLAQVRRLMDRFPGRTTLGEISSQDGAFDRVRRLTAGERHLHMAYTLRPLRGGFDHASLRALLDEVAAGEDGWPCWSFSNHDVERAASRWHPRGRGAGHDADFARLLMAVLLSLRGSVSIYQGEELGLTEAELALSDLRDPFGIAFFPEFRGRDGSRTPMPWSEAAPQAGFTDGTPWLKVPEAHRPLAAERSGLFGDWRRFLHWRRGSAAMTRGHLIPLDLPAPLIGFVRECDGERILAVFNLAEEEVTADLGAFAGLRPLPETGFAPAISGETATLPPFGALFAALETVESRTPVPA
ncbi:MAG TPA: alpha-glucosidase family protein [Acetobacteraceae bacterium]|nr:alpha-glucosidase family protein [Acetobacteraceae bacterium]